MLSNAFDGLDTETRKRDDPRLHAVVPFFQVACVDLVRIDTFSPVVLTIRDQQQPSNFLRIEKGNRQSTLAFMT